MFVPTCLGVLSILGLRATELVVELRRDPQCWVVTLHNASKTPIRVWEDQNSWGYESLSFEARSGRKVKGVPRPKIQWRKNTPGYRDVAADGRIEFRIQTSDLNVPSGSEALRAVYAPKGDPEAVRCQVWSGRSVSKWVKLHP